MPTSPTKIYRFLLKHNLLIFVTIFIILILLICGAYIFTKFSQGEKDPLIARDQDQISLSKWSQRIKEIGGEKAYSEFIIDTNKEVLSKQHRQAHLFGEALYKNEGLNAVAVCDMSFNSGCYHSLIGLAVAYEGMKIIPVLLDRCSHSPNLDQSACYHGVGHGILSSIGYDLNSLKKSLAHCYELKEERVASGCFSGAFMEYNFQTMLLEEGKKRIYNSDHPYSPCYDLDNQLSNYCMFHQSQWWLRAIDKNLDDRIKEIDRLCYELPDKINQNLCYKGFGFQILNHINQDVARGKKICKSLKNREAELVCSGGIALYLKTTPGLNHNYKDFCRDPSFTNKEQEFCDLQITQVQTFD